MGKIKRRGRTESDCLALLSYAAAHRGENQTEKILGEACGLSQQRVAELLAKLRRDGSQNEGLARTAMKYGFRFRIYHKRRGLLLDVVYDGRSTRYD